jgi:hypothetical protein
VLHLLRLWCLLRRLHRLHRLHQLHRLCRPRRCKFWTNLRRVARLPRPLLRGVCICRMAAIHRTAQNNPSAGQVPSSTSSVSMSHWASVSPSGDVAQPQL